MDVHGYSEKKISLAETMDFLKENITKDSATYFGFKDAILIDRIADNWFHDKQNYDGRWTIIKEKVPQIGKVLDMAAGCGTFMLFGLQQGYDVWGVEPDIWKREYFRKKIISSNYPLWFSDRLIDGVGEALPFNAENFDIITTYQTLEHVQDVGKSIEEMLRVLRKGGVLYIKAPDYNCFFEPHYRIPFFPVMNKKLAYIYLKIIGRPTKGLETLNWTTKDEIIRKLNSICKIHIEDFDDLRRCYRKEKIKKLLPCFFNKDVILYFLNLAFELKVQIAKIGRSENNIDLWVIKE